MFVYGFVVVVVSKMQTIRENPPPKIHIHRNINDGLGLNGHRDKAGGGVGMCISWPLCLLLLQ